MPAILEYDCVNGLILHCGCDPVGLGEGNAPVVGNLKESCKNVVVFS